MIICFISLEAQTYRSSSPVDSLERERNLPAPSQPYSSMQTSFSSAMTLESESGALMQCSGITVNSEPHSDGADSAHSGAALGHLYQEICDQKDVIMSCLEEDKCDIEQVQGRSGPQQECRNPGMLGSRIFSRMQYLQTIFLFLLTIFKYLQSAFINVDVHIMF